MTAMSLYERPPANPREAIATLRDLLEKQKGEIQKVLPSHLSPERMARIAVNAVSRDAKLLQCTPISVLRCVMQAGSMGLEPGGPLGDSFLVPFRDKKTGTMICTLIVGYKGLISLARRSGQVLSIEAHAVYGKDHWSFRRDQDGTFFSHVPSEEQDPGPLLRVYGVARLKDTPLAAIEVMPRREVDAIMRATQSQGAYGPWKDHFSEMCRKTVVRRLSKYLPMSVEFADALDREDRIEKGLSPDPSTDDIIDMTAEPEHAEDKPVPQLISSAPVPRASPAPAAAPKAKSALDSLVKPKAAPKAATVAPPHCEHCGVVAGQAHFPGCPGDTSKAPLEDGGEIQGRDREPGEEG